MELSIHCYSLLIKWPVRYSNPKSTDIGLIYLHSSIYGVCLFTVTVRYSVGKFVIQIEKVVILD